MVFTWAGEHWFDLFQTVGVVAGLVFTFLAFRIDTKTRRVSNLIEITKAHREIWSELYRRPELARISQAEVDLKKSPIQPEEELFISLLILHLNCAYQAMRNHLYNEPEGMREDVRHFFSRPMPNAVWQKMKPFQDKKFVGFVETSQS